MMRTAALSQDLDPALLSRFDTSVKFDLPDEPCRTAILKQYARHLQDTDIRQLAAATPRMSGRDLRDVCEQTERRWASKVIRGEVPEGQLPPTQEYLDSAKGRALHSNLGAAPRHPSLMYPRALL